MEELQASAVKQQQQLEQQLLQQQQEYHEQKQKEKQQLNLQLRKLLLQSKNAVAVYLADGVVNSVKEFLYNPKDGMTFLSYYRRYKEILFKEKCKGWLNEKKVRLLLCKLSSITAQKRLQLYSTEKATKNLF